MMGSLTEDGNIITNATGCLVNINDFFHLMTAKHVVVDPVTDTPRDNNMLIFLNNKSGKPQARSMDDFKKSTGFNWIFHQNKHVDIAIIPFPVDPENDDIKMIPNSIFLSSDQLYEVYDVFFSAYQPGITMGQKILPMFRSGTISLMNEDSTFFIDAASFPGNSGSPVFVKPSLVRFDDKGNYALGGDTIGGRFIGIIDGSITYQDVTVSRQTGRDRITFEENMGLSKVWSVSFINEILNSEPFKEQIKRIKPQETSHSS